MKLDLKCASCGSNRFQLGDAPADDFIVECGECGHVIGTMGQLKDKLADVVALGPRVLVGASRKAFLGRVGRPADDARPPLARDVATAVTTVHAARAGVWGIRAHDVTATVDALDVLEALDGMP